MAKGIKTGGRTKGTPNKATPIKAQIEAALNAVGGQKYFEMLAIEHPAVFGGVLKAILPKDVNVGGQADNPIVTKIEVEIVNPSG